MLWCLSAQRSQRCTVNHRHYEDTGVCARRASVGRGCCLLSVVCCLLRSHARCSWCGVVWCGSQEFSRLRLGIGRPSDPASGGDAVTDFVLGKFTAAENEVLRTTTFPTAYRELWAWVDTEISKGWKS